jgi:cytochrome b561
MHETHEIAGWTIIVAISLHIAGAIKHHFIDKDNTLRRMLGKN